MNRALLFVVPAALAVGTTTLLNGAPPAQSWLTALFAVLAIGSQRVVAAPRWLGLSQSLMGTVQAVSWLVAGPWVAVLSAVGVVLFTRSQRTGVTIFNLASCVIYSAAGYWAFRLAGGQCLEVAEHPWGDVALPVAVGALVQLVANLAFAIWAIVTMSGHHPLRALQDAMRVMNLGSFNQIVGAVLWALLVWSIEPHGVGLLLGIAPLLIHMSVLRRIEAAERTQRETLATLVGAADTSDPYVAAHGQRVARYAQAMGRREGLGPRDIEHLDLASRLHDVGFISPMRRGEDPVPGHERRGSEVLAGLDLLEEAADLVARSHEPLGHLPASDQRDLVLGLLQVADAVDATVVARPDCDVDDVIRAVESDPARFHPAAVRALRQTRPRLVEAHGEPPSWFAHDLPRGVVGGGG